MRGIFEAPASAPAKSGCSSATPCASPSPSSASMPIPAANAEDLGLSVALDHELGEDVPLRVMVSPGTLPSSAAEALREIANWIERDRRLLSSRHWRTPPASPPRSWPSIEPGQRQDRPGGSADQA